MDMIFQEIETALLRAVRDMGIDGIDTVFCEHPNDLRHADIASNIAMVLAKKTSENPQVIAQGIIEKLEEYELPFVDSLDVAGPGFINIRLTASFFEEEIKNIHSLGGHYGDNKLFVNKKVLVEHSSPNLFKAFHIGHLMNNTVGESIVRLYKASGASVTTMAYPSDVSLGIGKAVWKLLQYGVDTLDTYETLEEKIAFLGRCYQEGTKEYDEHNIEKEVRGITQDIYEHRDTEAYQAYLRGKEINLEYFHTITKRLGSRFDALIYESEAGMVGKELVQQYTPEVYTMSGAAYIYQGEQEGLHTRVFINKDGNPTYEAKDTGLLKLKFDRYQPDYSVFVTDDQQGPYFEVVIQAASHINRSWKEKTTHVTHGRMTINGEQMSSRLGNTPLVSSILREVNQEVAKRSPRALDEKQADMISLAALKYTILKTQRGKTVNFDLETSLSFEGDSGPYLQYTYARIQSLLEKAKRQGIMVNSSMPSSWELTDLERYLYRFPSVVGQACSHHHPHVVVTYLTITAQLFNRWYNEVTIVDQEDSTSGYKLALAQATAIILKKGLWVLGIDAPQSM
jgi:arginyl-tRNA synthetase